MSYSKSFSGNKLAIVAAIGVFAAEQQTVDESYTASKGVIDGHQVQIAASESIVKRAFEDPSISDSIELDVNLHGHAGDDGKGTFGVQITGIPVEVDVAVAVEPPVPDAATEPGVTNAPTEPVAAE